VRYGAHRPVSRLCHNDLGRGNFIDDGTQLWLIDWEYAGVGDPYYDLAFIAHNNRLSPEEEAELVQAYAGQYHPRDLEHLARMKVAHDFFHVFWYASQLSSTDTPGTIFGETANFMRIAWKASCRHLAKTGRTIQRLRGDRRNPPPERDDGGWIGRPWPVERMGGDT
jgi:thiamine kinase-like enzyme